MFDDDDNGTEEFDGEATYDDGDAVEEVRDGVLERIWLDAVGDWRVDLTFDFDIEVSLRRGDVNVLGLEVLFVVKVGGWDWFVVEEGGIDWFGVAFEALVKRWETSDDEDELALIVDVGLIERLRDATVDVRICCNPGAVGLGIKPKRVCIVIGGGARFVIDNGLLKPKIWKIKITTIIERKVCKKIIDEKCWFDKR